MKTRSVYRSILETPGGIVQRSDFNRLFLTRGMSYDDDKMDSLGIDRIVSGGITLSYDRSRWGNEVIDFVVDLMSDAINAGYIEEELMVEAVRKGYKYSVSVVMFRGIVERKLFLLSEYDAAGGVQKELMRNGMVSMMN